MTHEHDKPAGWIGVDFDGTLAHYEKWVAPNHCGEPIQPMVDRVKRWLAEGREVRIFTARVFPCGYIDAGATVQTDHLHDGREKDALVAGKAIQLWCLKNLGQVLTVTCIKDYGMVELWDDRAVQVLANQGEPAGFSTRGLS